MKKRVAILLMSVLATGFTLAGDVSLEVESGVVWFSKNDTRIPGDTGTKIDLLDLTGSGPDAYVRLYATYAFNDRHTLRLTLAPIEVEGTGTLDRETTFKDEVFNPGVPTKATYRFNTYRLTYRWTFHDSERWTWGVGAAALVRDAEIALEQGDKKQSRDDLGVVPLLHLYGEYTWTEDLDLILDVEGLGSPQGRAFDAALKACYALDENWHASVGYRTLEGGSDNDDVYTFAWLHYALIEIGCRF
ncbi:MAG: hypothetical protein KDL31_12765 [Kiritimatiellae bacterium]|nr:hypothetical protein [Kiritimatiellia bacterium]